ncbi:MAG TPA: oligosaccharide flippase family protein [Niabella sp.]|nr:oligosaccharide flippase family protein [Niabella sp.]HOZ96556.1 oligosaccharide flippase family protein [Niabella sp.]HQW13263.1 oligosaccharide flippase family protein [Niabella sp.]HQX18697.1 oligosaccharide flippase family protein [Niabella sp.]HQX40350.1 oligosaccharide flippase family protein [Niabella sp.]
MSDIKKLAGQTIWYGVSSIAARFINYLLTPYLIFKLGKVWYGEQSLIYSYIPFMNVIFTYGMETAFFRFTQIKDSKQVFSTTSLSMFTSSIFLCILLVAFHVPIANLLMVETHPEYILLASAIIFFDALSTIPFAKLRLDGRPRKYAMIKVFGILLNMGCLYFFLSICPDFAKKNPTGSIGFFFNKNWLVGYVFVANLIQSIVTFLLLTKEFFAFEFKFDKQVWKQMLLYGLPIMVAGFAGMINETFDRIMLGWWAPVANETAAKAEVGIYSACYKLSLLISLSVQAFRMGAEPFFFKQSLSENAPKTYARVMKFFVITLCLMFLFVILYIDIWKYFITDPTMWVGLKVVPVLLLANMFLGIYYNLSIWYKLGNKTIAGAYITLIGAGVTLIINYLFIPVYSYVACAWATLACYGIMMVVSYLWGQKNYRIPYATRKLCAYILIAVIISLIHYLITNQFPNAWVNYSLATILFGLYFLLIINIERKELVTLPLIGKYLKKK